MVRGLGPLDIPTTPVDPDPMEDWRVYDSTDLAGNSGGGGEGTLSFLGEEDPALPGCPPAAAAPLSLAEEMREGGRGRAISDSLTFSRWTLLGR